MPSTILWPGEGEGEVFFLPPPFPKLNVSMIRSKGPKDTNGPHKDTNA